MRCWCVFVGHLNEGGLKGGKSYTATVARSSWPALHRISAKAKTRYFLLAPVEGVRLLRRGLERKKLVVCLNNTVHSKIQSSVVSSGSADLNVV